MSQSETMTILFETLKNHGQGHLVDHYNSLSGPLAESFLNQLQTLDCQLIDRLYQELVKNPLHNHSPRELSPLKPDVLSDSDREEYRKIGLEAIAKGQVAVLLLAGGQGSRLGHEGPKGTFKIGLPGGETLFALQAQALMRVVAESGRVIPWYVMTSDTNHSETVQDFEARNYYDYPKEAVHFFQQGMMPAVNFDNQILLSDMGQLALSPDGNGGCFIAMKRHGILDSLADQGVKWLFLYGVDNAIVEMADPVFVGYTIASGKPAASKVVKKASPEEKVGVLCYDHGRPAIVEYSEMTQEATELRDANGELVYQNGNILNHLLSIEALAAYMDQPLTFHLATKKIPYWSNSALNIPEAPNGALNIPEALNGALNIPEAPNGYKFESFIFDLFPHFEDMAALMVQREVEFAPVKNATGDDSPETARVLYHKKFG